MKLWIARNKRGEIHVFQDKPTLVEKTFVSSVSGFGMTLKQTNNNRTFLKHITFENSPQEIELKLIEK